MRCFWGARLQGYAILCAYLSIRCISEGREGNYGGRHMLRRDQSDVWSLLIIAAPPVRDQLMVFLWWYFYEMVLRQDVLIETAFCEYYECVCLGQRLQPDPQRQSTRLLRCDCDIPAITHICPAQQMVLNPSKFSFFPTSSIVSPREHLGGLYSSLCCAFFTSKTQRSSSQNPAKTWR
jgi:hypothetical protein